MIKNMYIINNSGICIFHLNCNTLLFKENDQDKLKNAQLISGFFTAIDTFAQSMKGYNQYLKSISLRDINFYFYKENGYSFVLETDNQNKNLIMEDFIDILKAAADYFYENNDIDKEDIMQLIENPKISGGFNEIIAKVVRRGLFRAS